MEIETDYENKTFKNENQMSESSRYNDGLDYLHSYSSLISTTMDKPNIYISLVHSNCVQPKQGNPSSIKTFQSENTTKMSTRRGSFTISDLSYDVYNEVSNKSISPIKANLSLMEVDRISSTNRYERLEHK